MRGSGVILYYSHLADVFMQSYLYLIRLSRGQSLLELWSYCGYTGALTTNLPGPRYSLRIHVLPPAARRTHHRQTAVHLVQVDEHGDVPGPQGEGVYGGPVLPLLTLLQA